jgi:hypothetical protein
MPDLSNNSQWQLIVDQSLTKFGIDPISQTFAILFSNKYLKVFVTTTKQTLYYAGNLSLMIGSINSDSFYASTKKLYFNNPRLVEFGLIENAVSSQFSLKYTAPTWVTDVHLQIYQYQEI